MKIENENLVFVYGTLMSGFGNNALLRNGNAELQTTACIRATMYDLGCFPGVKLCGPNDDNPPRGKNVVGEVWKVDKPTLKNLDRLEGEGVLYKRKTTTILHNERNNWGGKKVWVYEIMREQDEESLVASGDYRKHYDTHPANRFRL